MIDSTPYISRELSTFENALIELDNAIADDRENQGARDLLKGTRIGALNAIYDRAEQNKNEIIEFSLLELPSDPSNLEWWYPIKYGWGDTLDMFNTIYAEYVHLGQLSLTEERAILSREALLQQAGINLLINLERHGGDLRSFYILRDGNQDLRVISPQVSYLRNVYPKPSYMSSDDYDRFILEMRAMMNKAFSNPDAALLARNGRPLPQGVSNDEYGNKVSGSFVFLTDKGYFTNSRFQMNYYTMISDHINVYTLAPLFLPSATCVSLGGKSVGEFLSNKYIFSASRLNKLGFVQGNVAAAGIGTIGTVGLTSVGVPTPLAETVGNIAIFTPQAKVTKKLLDKTVALLPRELSDELSYRIGVNIDELFEELSRNVHFKTKRQLFDYLKTYDSTFPEELFDDIYQRAFAKAQLDVLGRKEEVKNLMHKGLSRADIEGRGEKLAEGGFGVAYTLPEYPNDIFKIIKTPSSIFLDERMFRELKALKVMDDIPELKGFVPKITKIDEQGRWFAMTKLEGARLETDMGGFMEVLDLRINHKNPALSLTREQAAQAKQDIFEGFLDLEQKFRKNNLYDLDWKNGENILVKMAKNPDGTVSVNVQRIDFGMTFYGKEQLRENEYETIVREAIQIHFDGHVEIPEPVLNVDYFKS